MPQLFYIRWSFISEFKRMEFSVHAHFWLYEDKSLSLVSIDCRSHGKCAVIIHILTGFSHEHSFIEHTRQLNPHCIKVSFLLTMPFIYLCFDVTQVHCNLKKNKNKHTSSEQKVYSWIIHILIVIQMIEMENKNDIKFDNQKVCHLWTTPLLNSQNVLLFVMLHIISPIRV